WLYVFISTAITVILIDLIMIRGKIKIVKERKYTLLKLLTPDIVIEKNKKKHFYFMLFLIGFGLIFIILIPQTAIAGLIFAMVLSIIRKRRLQKLVKEIDWEFLIFNACMFILVGILSNINFIYTLSDVLVSFIKGSGFLAVVLIFIITTLFSGIMSGNTVVLVFLPIVTRLITVGEFKTHAIPMVLALLYGVNIGGNITPNGSLCTLTTLERAKKNNIKDYNYKRLLKYSCIFGSIQVAIAICFLLYFF
ncbi:MAG: SLC13 family permease, partial [Candidatus Hodarchaeota archaeon]